MERIVGTDLNYHKERLFMRNPDLLGNLIDRHAVPLELFMSTKRSKHEFHRGGDCDSSQANVHINSLSARLFLDFYDADVN